MKKRVTIIIILLLFQIATKAQDLWNKEQFTYFYAYINSLPAKCNVSTKFAQDIKAAHQYSLLFFDLNKTVDSKCIACENIVLYKESPFPNKRLHANIYSGKSDEGYIQSILVYVDINLAYIVTYAKAYQQENAICFIWVLKDGVILKMMEDISPMTKFSNNDNAIWDKIFIKDNMIIIREYSEIVAFAVSGYGFDGVFKTVK